MKIAQADKSLRSERCVLPAGEGETVWLCQVLTSLGNWPGTVRGALNSAHHDIKKTVNRGTHTEQGE